jgi:hypothetical protein
MSTQFDLFSSEAAPESQEMVNGYAPGWPECMMTPEAAENYQKLIYGVMLLCTPEGRKVPAPAIEVPPGFVQVDRLDVRPGDFVIADQTRLGYGNYPWPIAGRVLGIDKRQQMATLSDDVPGLKGGHTIALPEDVVSVHRCIPTG